MITHYAGFEITALHAAFNAVHNAKNWKLPIDAVVSAEALAITLVAIPFMVGGACTVTATKEGTFRVQNAGYYDNIGA